MNDMLRRPLHPETRILDAKSGTVEYIASDETLDSYHELIRADGWRFNYFAKNSPFVDSHNHWSIEDQLGSVIDFAVKDGKLIETVKWAIDVPENRLAKLGFAMTEAGHLKAVSVGFWPKKTVSKWDRDLSSYREELKKLGEDEETGPRVIYLEQEQVELSAVIIGSNPNALARAYKSCVISDADLDFLSERAHKASEPATEPIIPAAAPEHPRPAPRLALYLKIREIVNRL